MRLWGRRPASVARGGGGGGPGKNSATCDGYNDELLALQEEEFFPGDVDVGVGTLLAHQHEAQIRAQGEGKTNGASLEVITD